MRETIGNIKKVKPRFGSALMAYAFYRSQALQGFSGRRRCTRAHLCRPATSLTV
ncbi:MULTISPECIES: hypothetical protein [unclassified Mesorhizobium]|uniref:hypothetical protein n=1 Tax=unclassified Mesorhizobium TaxID=325217 RepID=UPI0003CF2153|nr:hypothetical protein X764_29575 [Mesorhizobium sp. LSHC440A00]